MDVHDFPSDAVGKAIPYGVSDLAANEGFVSVGVDYDTPVFAVRSIEAWWSRVGAKRYPPQSQRRGWRARLGFSRSAKARFPGFEDFFVLARRIEMGNVVGVLPKTPCVLK